MHDGVDFTISEKMKQRFSFSHDARSYFSVDDIHKPRLLKDYNQYQLSEEEFYHALREKRGHVMEWVLFSPKVMTP